MVMAAAVIEHIEHAESVRSKFHRILRVNGVCVLTTPNQFMGSAAAKLEIFEDKTHCRYLLTQLGELLMSSAFEVVEARRFMLYPLGMPGARLFEWLLKGCRLDFALTNQIAVGRKR